MDFAAEEGFPTGDGIDLLTQRLLPTGDLRELQRGKVLRFSSEGSRQRDEAVELYARALAIFVLDPSHPKVVMFCRENYARLKSNNHPPAIEQRDLYANGNFRYGDVRGTNNSFQFQNRSIEMVKNTWASLCKEAPFRFRKLNATTDAFTP